MIKKVQQCHFLFYVFTFSVSLQLFIQAALSDSDIVPNVRDDNYDTCAVFTPVLSFPWFYDFSIPVYYWNAPGTVAVELVGDNIGCSLGNDAKFFIFPVSTWSDATGVSGLRSTCIFYEATVAKGTRLQKCVYTCRYTRDTIALRVIRLPYNKIHSSWKLCEVSNIFYGRYSVSLNNISHIQLVRHPLFTK